MSTVYRNICKCDALAAAYQQSSWKEKLKVNNTEKGLLGNVNAAWFYLNKRETPIVPLAGG